MCGLLVTVDAVAAPRRLGRTGNAALTRRAVVR